MVYQNRFPFRIFQAHNHILGITYFVSKFRQSLKIRMVYQNHCCSWVHPFQVTRPRPSLEQPRPRPSPQHPPALTRTRHPTTWPVLYQLDFLHIGDSSFEIYTPLHGEWYFQMDWAVEKLHLTFTPPPHLSNILVLLSTEGVHIYFILKNSMG